MTHDKAVYEALSASGIPGTKMAYPVGKTPALPFFVYMQESGGETFADNKNYETLTRYRAELYQKDNDPSVREAFESAVAAVGPFTTNEGWIASENCYMTAYSFTYHFHDKED